MGCMHHHDIRRAACVSPLHYYRRSHLALSQVHDAAELQRAVEVAGAVDEGVGEEVHVHL